MYPIFYIIFDSNLLKDPEPFEPTDKIINEDFVRGGSEACQNDLLLTKFTGTEDCLHLSVYTKNLKPEKLKPVMIWIHGGGYVCGSNSKDFFNPEFLLRNDVVVACVNYRLGAFGMSKYNRSFKFVQCENNDKCYEYLRNRFSEF